MAIQSTPVLESPPVSGNRLRDTLLYFRRNRALIAGCVLLLLIVLFVIVGAIVTDPVVARAVTPWVVKSCARAHVCVCVCVCV